MNTKDINDMNALVMGASGGIGSVVSRELFHKCAHVTMSARKEGPLKDLQHSLGIGCLSKTTVFPARAHESSDVEKLFEKMDRIGVLPDIIVLSIGRWIKVDIDTDLETAVKAAREHFDSFYLPLLVVSHIANRYAKTRGKPIRIFNISSHAAYRTDLPANLTYGPIKAAARHFAHLTREADKLEHIQLVDLQPAIVNTAGNEGLLDTKVKKEGAVQPAEIAQWIIEHAGSSDLPIEHEFKSDVVV